MFASRSDGVAERRRTVVIRAQTNRIRNLLIVSEIALGFVILIGAGLMVRTLMQLHRIGPGFDPNHTLTFQLSFNVGYDSIPERTEFETLWEENCPPCQA